MNDESELEAWHGFPANGFNHHAWVVGEPQIGENTWIGAFTVIDGSGGLVIGTGCDISAGAHIYTHSTVHRCVSGRRFNQVDHKPTVVGDCVHVGANATILMGCRIGHHSVIGAGTVVVEDSDIPPYSIVVGVPGRVLETSSRKWLEENDI